MLTEVQRLQEQMEQALFCLLNSLFQCLNINYQPQILWHDKDFSWHSKFINEKRKIIFFLQIRSSIKVTLHSARF